MSEKIIGKLTYHDLVWPEKIYGYLLRSTAATHTDELVTYLEGKDNALACEYVRAPQWVSVEDRLPTKQDGWIGYKRRNGEKPRYFIRVLAREAGGYGARIVIREYYVDITGEWTMENDKCEIVSGSFKDRDWHDWIVTHWMPLPAPPEPTS